MTVIKRKRLIHTSKANYSKISIKWPLKNRQNKDLNENGSLMKVKSITECSPWSSIPARSHTFVEIDHEIISTVILLPSAESFKKGFCQLQAKVCAGGTG